MADQDIMHTAEIIKAALPYVDTKTKGTAELFAKLLDLLGSLKSIGNTGNVAATGFQAVKIDLEGLLKGIRPICNNKEREFVDKILNFFNMKRMFEMYNNMMATMKTMQEFGGFNFNDSGADAENIARNFAGSNFESIFQNAGFGSFSGETKKETEQNDTEAKSGFFDSSVNNASDYHTSDNSTSDYHNSDNSTSDNFASDNHHTESDTGQNNTPNFGSSGNGMNSRMFDMLKAMVPPEQMSTFENLSMLLNTMSYDNTSKPDDSKEKKDG